MSISLSLEQQDYRVSRPYSGFYNHPNEKGIPLFSGMKIEDIFDNPEIGNRLLILGEPGSGKTTMMFELAEKLLIRSLNSLDQPIPVILNLSSWKNPNVSIFEWIISEMKSKHGVAFSSSKKLLSENQLFILLDGLDEVIPQEQQECALAINRWLSEDINQEPAGTVICCRDMEYEDIIQSTQSTRLALHGAIFIRPLSESQIQDYLKILKLDNLWKEMQFNPSILRLLTKPLFLSMFALIQKYNPKSLLKDFSRDSDQVNSLFSVYIETMLKNPLIINLTSYGKSIKSNEKSIREQYDVLKILSYSSIVLDKESRNGIDILIEELQPSILSKKQKIEYKILVSFLMSVPPSLVFGIVMGTFACFEPSVSDVSGISRIIIFPVGLSLGLTLILLIFPVILLAFAIPGKLDYIEPIGIISFSVKDYNFRFKQIFPNITREIFNMGIWSISISFISCSVFGIVGGFLSTINTNSSGGIFLGVFAGLLMGMIIGIIFGIFFACTVGLVRGFMKGLIDGLKEDIQVTIKPNQAIKNSLFNARTVAAYLFLFSVVLYIPLVYLLKYYHWDAKVIPGTLWITFTLLIWSGFHESGGKAFIQHLGLRIVLARHKLIPLHYDLILDYATERRILQRVGGRYRFIHQLLQKYFTNRYSG